MASGHAAPGTPREQRCWGTELFWVKIASNEIRFLSRNYSYTGVSTERERPSQGTGQEEMKGLALL